MFICICMYVCAVYVNTDVYKSEVIVVACSRQKEARQVGVSLPLAQHTGL